MTKRAVGGSRPSGARPRPAKSAASAPVAAPLGLSAPARRHITAASIEAGPNGGPEFGLTL